MDLNHGSTGYEPVGISGRTGDPGVFLTTLPRCGAVDEAAVYEPIPRKNRDGTAQSPEGAGTRKTGALRAAARKGR